MWTHLFKVKIRASRKRLLSFRFPLKCGYLLARWENISFLIINVFHEDIRLQKNRNWKHADFLNFIAPRTHILTIMTCFEKIISVFKIINNAQSKLLQGTRLFINCY
jgi:flagellar biosynthesis protein FliP